eukprot:5305703-Prymnesium_polylepis.1
MALGCKQGLKKRRTFSYRSALATRPGPTAAPRGPFSTRQARSDRLVAFLHARSTEHGAACVGCLQDQEEDRSGSARAQSVHEFCSPRGDCGHTHRDPHVPVQ